MVEGDPGQGIESGGFDEAKMRAEWSTKSIRELQSIEEAFYDASYNYRVGHTVQPEVVANMQRRYPGWEKKDFQDASTLASLMWQELEKGPR